MNKEANLVQTKLWASPHPFLKLLGNRVRKAGPDCCVCTAMLTHHLCSNLQGPLVPHHLIPGSPPLALGVWGLAAVAVVVAVVVEEEPKELSVEAPA